MPVTGAIGLPLKTGANCGRPVNASGQCIRVQNMVVSTGGTVSKDAGCFSGALPASSEKLKSAMSRASSAKRAACSTFSAAWARRGAGGPVSDVRGLRPALNQRERLVHNPDRAGSRHPSGVGRCAERERTGPAAWRAADDRQPIGIVRECGPRSRPGGRDRHGASSADCRHRLAGWLDGEGTRVLSDPERLPGDGQRSVSLGSGIDRDQEGNDSVARG